METCTALESRGLDARVAEVVRDRILSGELRPGAHLKESALATELGVSHGTVRAGLHRLQPEGLVVYRPNRGIFVNSLSSEDVLEIYSLRNTLEGMASRLCAQRLTPQAAEHLSNALDRLRESVKIGAAADAVNVDREIHELIVELSGHSRLQAAHAALFSQTALFMQLSRDLHEDLDEVYAMHEPLVRAILAGDAHGAEEIARSHNTEDGEALRSQIFNFVGDHEARAW